MDLPSTTDWVVMRTTGEIVFVRQVEKDGDHFLYFYIHQQGESVDKKKIKRSCDHDLTLIQFCLHFLFIQILWREYLAISCELCKDIKLVDLETLDITTAFSNDQKLGKMCKGWHKIYVEVSRSFLELDCSSTKFTKMRQIYLEAWDDAFRKDVCYIPSPHNMILTATWNTLEKGGKIVSASLDDASKTVWHLSDKVVYPKVITPSGVVYSSRHDTLLVVDENNRTVWVLNSSTGEVLQNIAVSRVNDLMKVFLLGSQLVIVSDSRIQYFTLA